MSLSSDIADYEFEVVPAEGTRAYYYAEDVEEKLDQWATQVAKLEEDAQILRTLRSQVEGFWKEYEEKREKERQLGA